MLNLPAILDRIAARRGGLAALSKLSGVSVKSLGRYRKGSRPSLPHLQRLTAVLSVRAD